MDSSVVSYIDNCFIKTRITKIDNDDVYGLIETIDKDILKKYKLIIGYIDDIENNNIILCDLLSTFTIGYVSSMKWSDNSKPVTYSAKWCVKRKYQLPVVRIISYPLNYELHFEEINSDFPLLRGLNINFLNNEFSISNIFSKSCYPTMINNLMVNPIKENILEGTIQIIDKRYIQNLTISIGKKNQNSVLLFSNVNANFTLLFGQIWKWSVNGNFNNIFNWNDTMIVMAWNWDDRYGLFDEYWKNNTIQIEKDKWNKIVVNQLVQEIDLVKYEKDVDIISDSLSNIRI